MPRTPHKGVQILRFPMGLVQVFFRPNPENFRLFLVRRTPPASMPLRAIRRRQHHVHGMILQNDPCTHRPPIVLSLMNVMMNPTFTHIAERMLTFPNYYSTHT